VTLGGREEGAGAPSGNVPSQAPAAMSAQKFKQWVEGAGNAGVFGTAVVVGYAACQPSVDPDGGQAGDGGEVDKVNDLDGTLEESEVFKQFMEQFEREKKEQEEGGKPVTQPLEIPGEVRKTKLMKFVERQFRTNQRAKPRKGHVGKGRAEGRAVGAAKGGQRGQGGQMRGAGQPQKGAPSSKARPKHARKLPDLAAQGSGPVWSKDPSAPAARQGKGLFPTKPQAAAPGRNPRTANVASGDSNSYARGTSAQQRGKKEGKAAEDAGRKAAAKTNVLNPNATSFA